MLPVRQKQIFPIKKIVTRHCNNIPPEKVTASPQAADPIFREYGGALHISRHGFKRCLLNGMGVDTAQDDGAEEHNDSSLIQGERRST